jgi:predicted secreted hydrolase
MYLHENDLSLSLELLSRKPPLFANRSGHIRFGLLGSSKYYSLTNMKVSGTLQLDENLFEVRGIGWMDRQWGNWDYTGIGGWNWFSIQLSNNVEILAGQFFHPITRNPISRIFNLIDDEGRTKVYDRLRIKCLSTWRSPRTDSVYGTGWKVSLPQDTNLLVSPVFDDQEIYSGFWEGCCEVKGKLQGQSVEGVGYAEQSYLSPNRLLLRSISLGAAPFHYIAQLILRRVDFGVLKLPYELIDRLFRRKKV